MIHKLLLLFSLSLFAMRSLSQDIAVMSYNIRYDNPNDGDNQWSLRKGFLINQLFYHNPDIIGMQEALKSQLDVIDQLMPGMEYLGVGRDDGLEGGEFSPIFYKKGAFEVLEQGTFWLSPNPDIPSKGWDAALNRICTYALFKGKRKGAKQKFWVFNTHFDHRGKMARAESIKVIKAQIEQLNTKGYPVIITGDFNLVPEEAPIQDMQLDYKDSYLLSALPPFGPYGTFNGFDWNKEISNRIDYVFISSDFDVIHHATISDSIDQKYASDHFPVLVKLVFKR